MALPTAMNTRLASNNRRWPKRSLSKPAVTPKKAEVALKMEVIQPAATKPIISSLRNSGSAAGILPTWNAASRPAAVVSAITSQRVR